MILQDPCLSSPPTIREAGHVPTSKLQGCLQHCCGSSISPPWSCIPKGDGCESRFIVYGKPVRTLRNLERSSHDEPKLPFDSTLCESTHRSRFDQIRVVRQPKLHNNCCANFVSTISILVRLICPQSLDVSDFAFSSAGTVMTDHGHLSASH